jgi:hypothetical protein
VQHVIGYRVLGSAAGLVSEISVCFCSVRWMGVGMEYELKLLLGGHLC